MNNKNWINFIDKALEEDLGEGDHTTLAIIPKDVVGKANLYVKEEGILAGIEIAKNIFIHYDPNAKINIYLKDGQYCKGNYEIAFDIETTIHNLLKLERLVLNILQRMSGIATETHKYVKAVEGTKAKILDTRKTTPGFRFFEKEAVRIGGGLNHRFGLFDMILIKDNHIDFAGGIENALRKTLDYLKQNNLNIPVEIEARSIEDVQKILKIGGAQRILLDNFNIEQTRKAVDICKSSIELESSGGITLSNVRDYALCGVDYISIGALTHHIKSLDLSLKATLK